MRGFWEAILLDQLCLLDWPLSLSRAKSALLPPNSSRFHHGGWPHLQRYPALEVNDGGCPEKPDHLTWHRPEVSDQVEIGCSGVGIGQKEEAIPLTSTHSDRTHKRACDRL
jgi:hypothetical protein